MDSHLRIKYLESQLRHTTHQLATLQSQHDLLKAELGIVEKMKENRMLSRDEQAKIWNMVCELAMKISHPLCRELADACREVFDPAVWMQPAELIALRKAIIEEEPSNAP